MASSNTTSFDTQHEDMIHDVQMNYYGRRMATCSSDKSIKIWDLALDGSTTLTSELKSHEGPVWQVGWSHPKFGNYLASCSYDRKVIIWKETNKNDWKPVFEYSGHELSVNSIAWAPPEYGLILACASSDTHISILSHKGGDVFSEEKFPAHEIGVNAVSWSSATSSIKRLVSGGCDNSVKIWRFSETESQWKLEQKLEAHSDWVRDVAWAPNIGLPSTTIASCSQDGSVIVWVQEEPDPRFLHKVIYKSKDVVWRVSWSITGNILAVSGGDNKVTLWKESLEGEWKPVYSMDEGGQLKEQQ